MVEKTAYANKPFLDRQRDFVEKVEGKKQEREVEEAETFKGYFKPSIGKSEEVLMKNRPEIVCESDRERVVRLAVKDYENMFERREAKINDTYKQYTFEPEINNVSRAIGGNMVFSLEELNQNRKGEAIRERARKSAEDKFKAECTFKPKIPKMMMKPKEEGVEASEKDGRFQLNLSNPDDLTLQVTRYNEAKEEGRQQKIREREMQELQQCTFKVSDKERRVAKRRADKTCSWNTT